MVQFIRDRSFV